MRVLNLLNSNHRRGAEAFALDLAAELRRGGVDVRSMALGTASEGAIHDVDSLGSLPRVARIRELLRSARSVDVVIGHGGRTLVAGSAIGRWTRTPFVYRVIGEPNRWARSPSQRLRVVFGMRLSTAIVVYYDRVADDIAARYRVERSKIHVIPKGIDTTAFPPVDEAGRAHARRQVLDEDASDEGPVIAYVGALATLKNVEQTVHATALVPGAHLLLAGTGPCAPALVGEANRLAVPVTHVAGLSDVALAYAAADVLVLTSRTEGVPAVLLEAGLTGIPVVATSVGGIADVVLDGETGYLVPVDDVAATASAIASAIDNRDALGTRARAHVLANYDITAVAPAWIALLRRAADA